MELLEKAKLLLKQEELEKLQKYIENGGHCLAPNTASTFFELFLRGKTTQEIHSLNKSFPYESILYSRVKYDWDKSRDEYTIDLQNNIKTKMIQTQMESVSFLSDVLSMTHKKYGEKIAKYLQSGDESELDGFEIKNGSAYAKILESILKASGQDQNKKIKLEGLLSQSITTDNSKPQNILDRPINSDTAASLLEILANEIKEEFDDH